MENKEESISLGDIFNVIKKNIILVAIIIASITVIGSIVTIKTIKPKYASTSSVVVQVPSTGDKYDITNSLRFTETVSDTIKESSILNPIALEFDLTYTQLKGMVDVSNETNSALIRIKVTNNDPEKAQALANAIAQKVVSEAKADGVFFFVAGYIVQTGDALKGQYTSPNKLLLIIISFAVACVVAFAFVFIKEFMSNKFKTKDEVQNLSGEKIIGVFNDNPVYKKEEYRITEPDIHSIEQCNKLLSNIKYSNLDNPYKVIAFTSTIKGELKSTSVSKLAQCISLNNKKVLVIDLDLRDPSIHKIFGVVKENGIIEYLDGSITKEKAIKPGSYNIDLITSGKVVSNPVSVLESNKLFELINDLKNDYDYILIDTPPAYSFADATIISKISDGLIYNVSINCAIKKQVLESLENIKRADINLIGINVTKTTITKKELNNYYYYSTEK